MKEDDVTFIIVLITRYQTNQVFIGQLLHYHSCMVNKKRVCSENPLPNFSFFFFILFQLPV